MVNKGLAKYAIFRGDNERYTIRLFARQQDGDEPIDIAFKFREIRMQIRSGGNENTPLYKTLTLTGGDFTITDTNVLNFQLQTDQYAGVYYYDIRFQKRIGNDWETYIKGIINVQANTTRL